jgi:hypothetical protein
MSENHDFLAKVCFLLSVLLIFLILTFTSFYLIKAFDITSHFNHREQFNEKYLILPPNDKNEYKLTTLYNGL